MPDYTSAVDVVAAMQDAWDAAAEAEDIEEVVPEEPAQYTPPESEEVVVNGEVPTAASGQRCVALFSYEVRKRSSINYINANFMDFLPLPSPVSQVVKHESYPSPLVTSIFF